MVSILEVKKICKSKFIIVKFECTTESIFLQRNNLFANIILFIRQYARNFQRDILDAQRQNAMTRVLKIASTLCKNLSICVHTCYVPTSFLNYTSITAALLNYQMDSLCYTTHVYTYIHYKARFNFERVYTYIRLACIAGNTPVHSYCRNGKRGPESIDGFPTAMTRARFARFAKRNKSSLNFCARSLPEGLYPKRWA